MLSEPPPKPSDFNTIWRRWLYGFWQRFNDLGSTTTDDGSKGFHLVKYPFLPGETGVVNYEFHYDNVLRFIPYSFHAGIRAATNTTSLSSYIQNALDSASSLGSGQVTFPPGTYKSTTQLNLPVGVSLIGSGRGVGITSGVRIDASAGTNHIISLEKDSPTVINAKNKISGMILNGNSTGDGLRLKYVSYVTVTEIMVIGCKNNIVLIGDLYGITIADCSIDNAIDYGLYLTGGGTGINVNSFTRNQYSLNVKAHIYIDSTNSYGNQFTHSNFNGGGVALWATESAHQSTFSFNAVENSDTTNSVYIGQKTYTGSTVGAPYNWHIEGNNFLGNGSPTHHLNLDVGNRHTVINNLFQGTPGTAYVRLGFIGSMTFEGNTAITGANKPMLEGLNVSTGIFNNSVNATLTFAAGDATPSVMIDQGISGQPSHGNKLFKTGNTGGTTITDLDDGFLGQTVRIVFKDTNTTVDFTGSSMIGNSGVDYSPGVDDSMLCTYDGSVWYCTVSK